MLDGLRDCVSAVGLVKAVKRQDAEHALSKGPRFDQLLGESVGDRWGTSMKGMPLRWID